jgi:hypothetical protein
MAAPILARIRRDAARLIDETFAEHQAAGRLDELTYEARVAVSEYATLAARVCEEWKERGRTLSTAWSAGRYAEVESLANSLPEMFDSAIQVLETLHRWLTLLGAAGLSVPPASAVSPALESIRQMQHEALEHWTGPPTEEEVAEAIADYENGDSLPLDEAFAEIAGVSVEEWLQRVEDYKQKWHLEGPDSQ